MTRYVLIAMLARGALAVAHPEVFEVLFGLREWAVVHGDNREVLPLLADGAVDHVISDPPYAPRAMKNVTTASMVQRREGVVYDFGYSALTSEQRIAAAHSFSRLARRWILAWCDIESDEAWREALRTSPAPCRYVRTGVWVRVNGAPQFSGDRPGQGIEACVIAHAPGRMRWNGGGRAAVWTYPIVNSQAAERVHSTPKPLPLMLEQVEQFTDAGEVVLDPFCGSGTTGVACLRLGRRFIGIEKDAKYAAVARERLAAESQGLTLRDARAGQQSLFGGGL